MRRLPRLIILVSAISALCISATAAERFPPPDFESGYQLPVTTTPPARQAIYEYLDVAVLVIALSLATYFILKKRSRRAIFILMLLAIAYFGFYRKGCICPIGAIGNVTLTIFDTEYAIPIVALIFFLLPLAFTLFFGRVFCGAVCPLGALQDLVLLKPVAIPRWLESGLRTFAYLYLSLAVLFAATGSAFLICRYDPFIAFFRLSGAANIIILGLCFLAVGVFIGRPYCRFLCPYGVILRQFSRTSRRRVTITPDDCINCRLCEDACPFGAIDKPTAPWSVETYAKDKKTLGLLIVLVPILALSGGWLASALAPATSRMHATVRLAERIYLENTGELTDTTDATDAFRATGKPTQHLYAEASTIRNQFRLGGWMIGIFVGAVAGLKLINHSIRWQRTEYQANRANCFACGRCYNYCPQQRAKLNNKQKKGSDAQ
jgi:NosR/NirI family nitrous oxide reductase transcriptional regulator